MTTIYFTLDAQGHLEGYGSTRMNEAEFAAEVEEGHEVLSCPEVFTYRDGKLVKDLAHQKELQDSYKSPVNETDELRKENVRLRKEIDMNALAFMEFAEIILGGGNK